MTTPAGRLRRASVAVATGVAVLANVAGAAWAGSSAQLTPQVFVAQPGVRYVVVSVPQGDTTFGDQAGCSGDGGFTAVELPNGTCGLDGVRITNGDAASSIEVSATDFVNWETGGPPVPAQNGLFTTLQVDGVDGGESGDLAPWVLCSVAPDGTADAAAGAPACAGPDAPGGGRYPGSDQVWFTTNGAGSSNADVSAVGPDPACDHALIGALGAGTCDLAPDVTALENLQVMAPSDTSDQSYTYQSTITWTALPPQ